MAREQRVFNTGNGVAKPVWNNANRVNHANHFVPRPVQLNAVRPNSNAVRPNSNSVRPNVNTVRQNVNSVRPNINTIRQNVNSVRPNVKIVRQNVKSVRSNINIVRPKQPVPTSNSNSFSSVRPQVNKFNQRRNFSKSHSLVRRPIVRNTAKMPYAVKGNWGTVVKTSAGYNWRNTRPNSNCNSGSNFVQTVHVKGPQGRPKPEKDWNANGDLLPLEGRNLQEEGLDKMVRSIVKDKSKDFETPTQGKTSGEADISPEGLEAAETLAKVLTRRTKTYTRKVKTGLRRKLDADEVNTGEGINTGFIDVNTAFEEINSGNESIIPSPKKGQREGKAVLEEKSQSKKTKKQIREE
ncbi:hypothetical protein Tco_1452100 [Tanacetum coccineum]